MFMISTLTMIKYQGNEMISGFYPAYTQSASRFTWVSQNQLLGSIFYTFHDIKQNPFSQSESFYFPNRYNLHFIHFRKIVVVTVNESFFLTHQTYSKATRYLICMALEIIFFSTFTVPHDIHQS